MSISMKRDVMPDLVAGWPIFDGIELIETGSFGKVESF